MTEKNEDNPKNVTEEKIETPEQDISNSESTAIKVDSEIPTAVLTPNILRVEKPDLKDISNNKQEVSIVSYLYLLTIVCRNIEKEKTIILYICPGGRSNKIRNTFNTCIGYKQRDSSCTGSCSLVQAD